MSESFHIQFTRCHVGENIGIYHKEYAALNRKSSMSMLVKTFLIILWQEPLSFLSN